ncbi:hypothetical protein BKA69DRAFT_99647 [Paraphysoderma sedebokerense]|nr:hypothetical protein BKA69DRAFT_99647 [Paraphysoderma sedebokerense]
MTSTDKCLTTLKIDRQLKHYHQTKLDLEQKLSNCQSQIEELKKSTQTLTALQTESAKAINQYQSLFHTVISDIQIKQEQLLKDREHDILNELLDRACDGSQGKGSRRVAGISNANRFEGKENNSAKGQPNLNKRHSVAREADESKDISNVATLCHPAQKLAHARQHLLRPTNLNNPSENLSYSNKSVNLGTENEIPNGEIEKMKQSAHESYAYSGIVRRLQKMGVTDDVFN